MDWVTDNPVIALALAVALLVLVWLERRGLPMKLFVVLPIIFAIIVVLALIAFYVWLWRGG
jgi:predicted exporter